MKHKHAEAIIAWANGEKIQFRADSGNGDWRDVVGLQLWNESCQYRVKPAAPKWPETTLTFDQCYSAGFGRQNKTVGLPVDCVAVANASLAHALETGQVVLPDPARDMRIAKAVHYACNSAIALNAVKSEDLTKIIAGVRHD